MSVEDYDAISMLYTAGIIIPQMIQKITSADIETLRRVGKNLLWLPSVTQKSKTQSSERHWKKK